MIKANLLSPLTDAKNMFDWGINFAPFIEPWSELYINSKQIPEPDIMVIADPEWKDPRFPDGLVIIDETENCAALLGLRYFGERKKGTLTLAWTIGTRQNMVACHGGIKTIGDRFIVAQDIRNENGRCIKSRDMFNHANSCARPRSVIWLQKDPSLPPVCKINDIGLAVAMGASLSTMRAKGVENVPAEELQKLVIEPFANPFRVHPLLVDCQQFRKLFKLGTECYVMNTHAFGIPGKETNITLDLSLSILTAISRNDIKWKEWDAFPGMFIPENGNDLFSKEYQDKFTPSKDLEYLKFLRKRVQDRITYLSNKRDIENDMDSAFIDPLVAARLPLDKAINPI